MAKDVRRHKFDFDGDSPARKRKSRDTHNATRSVAFIGMRLSGEEYGIRGGEGKRS